jgi:hypothetical protein
MTEIPLAELVADNQETPVSECDQAVAELLEYIKHLENKYENRIKFDPKLLEIKLGLSFSQVTATE